MISDDSLNESDESFFDLYSTKKVTNVYNEVLEKLKSAASKNETVTHEKIDNVEKKSKDEGEADVISLTKDDSLGIIVLDESDDPLSTNEDTGGVRRSTRLSRKGKTTNQQTLDSSQVRKRNTNTTRKRKKDEIIEIIEEDECKERSNFNISLDDEMNYEVSVKVIWKSVSIQTFRLRRFQKFTTIFQHFMKEENVPLEKILLSLKTTRITPSDTPDSLNLKVNDFIEGGVLSNSINVTSKRTIQTKCSIKKDCILVKVQDADKNRFKFSVNKTESLKSVMIRYAEQIEVPLEKLKFYFDGEILNPSETPATLGLDNDEIIDVKMMQ